MAHRYIDADELLKEASKDGAYGYVSAEQIVDFPTADVAVIKHGRWIYLGGVDAFECSVCGRQMVRNIFDYCPWCGAKMEGHFEEPEINPCRGCEDYDGKGGCISNGGCGAKMDEVTQDVDL